MILFDHHQPATLCMDKNESLAVQLAVQDFLRDLERVSGFCGHDVYPLDAAKKNSVVIGTLGDGALDAFLRAGNIDTQEISGRWENYIIQEKDGLTPCCHRSPRSDSCFPKQSDFADRDDAWALSVGVSSVRSLRKRQRIRPGDPGGGPGPGARYPGSQPIHRSALDALVGGRYADRFALDYRTDKSAAEWKRRFRRYPGREIIRRITV